MSEKFINDYLLYEGPWQALERNVARLMHHGRFDDVRLVGRTGDGGADVIASQNGKRWVVQVKFRRSQSLTDESAITEVLNALSRYRGNVPVLATNLLVGSNIKTRQTNLLAAGTKLQLWDRDFVKSYFKDLNEVSTKLKKPRSYQEKPIANIVDNYANSPIRSGVVIMATGMGKTFVAGESVRRLFEAGHIKRVLVLAHTNELVYQLERSFWSFLKKNQNTAVWNGYEVGDLDNASVTFACLASVYSKVEREGFLPWSYDLVIIDEAHHAGSPTYKEIINVLGAGKSGGPYLLGMTATPWRSDENDVADIFKTELCRIDIVEGMKNGFLSNIDYRLHVDNIDWDSFNQISGLTPRALNRTIFVKEWDDGVIDVLQNVWKDAYKPRGIVFCQTIEHANRMKDAINSRGFTSADVIYSGNASGKKMSTIERSTVLCDFSDGKIGIICAVDIFNEGIDVPDVNILVFQRVTHSRRIFVQQLGRGLRISEDKDKVIVLDFISDIRRIAAVSDLKNQLKDAPRYYNLPSPVKFVNKTGEVPGAEKFLTLWLKDVAQIQDAGEDDHVLEPPPDLRDYNVERNG